ncbi:MULTISPECIES: fluoride efflux transporter CrcB [Halomonadaceae]|jgi:CrcB protein|uniref:Fluoride-specific ion channel FluC n=1 Tax=Vreelandella janggokensis TaxID=370767 RepID=A0ABT4IXF8_9GAMM|nr:MULTISPECIES: fluoride efflux transporter CrcB [Halomonas]MCW4148918.1 fluoride efflux transporter CrcB [Halomonas sp. 18H]MCZ0927901.1 fluoride efflux transporter CrcB [Halomonas janggokensis]MCZ0930641.1 fluoride efflux transporter CrcB [Halomonas janggokensis]MDR5884558.1 fluoride efflux transporter CrcB [Halomonas janggokensis]QPL45409.1 fluoride efflux transporter CrcB [Halomonas sp. A40-4]
MKTLATYAAVGIGSGLGSALRYVISLSMTGTLGSSFPWGTLLVNVVGSGLIGWLAGRIARAPDAQRKRWQPFWVAGFCGGFTTFSLFSLEVVSLAQTQPILALAYIAVSLPLWLAAVWAGQRWANSG